MKQLPSCTKPKNGNEYYFTPTGDGKPKWIALGDDEQAVIERHHLLTQG